MAEGTAAILVGAPVTGTGGVLTAPLGTVAPASAVDALNEAFKAMGYVGEDGVTKTVDGTDEKIKAWGGDTVKIVRQEHSVGYSFTFLESSNATVLRALYGEENVIITPPTAEHGGQIEVRDTGELLAPAAYVFDMKDGKARTREFVPNGQIAFSGDVNFVHSNVISYQVTIDAMPDEDGIKAYTFMDDGIVSGAVDAGV